MHLRCDSEYALPKKDIDRFPRVEIDSQFHRIPCLGHRIEVRRLG